MELKILPQVVKEIKDEPIELRQSVFGTLERLGRGESIGMPLCKPLPSIAKGLYELRFSYRAGECRVFYYIKVREAIYVIHAMRKKSQKIERRTVDLLLSRIRRVP
jgi:phage-related protein